MKKNKTQKKMKPNMSRAVPLLLALGLFFVGLSLVGFGYFLFVRPSEADVVSKAEQEINDISVNFDSEKSAKIFEPNPQIPNISSPNYETKNPFTSF